MHRDQNSTIQNSGPLEKVAVVSAGDPMLDGLGAKLVQALILPQPSAVSLTLGLGDLGDFEAFDLSGRVAGASQDAVVLPEGLGRLPQSMWAALFASCREVLKPEGVLVLRLPGGAPAQSSVLPTESNALAKVSTALPAEGSAFPVESKALKTMLASSFDAIELFSWDGLWRTPADLGGVDRFAVCRPFLPYATRSLELLRPRVVACGEWQSSWLSVQPVLPDRFLLRATLDLIGDCQKLELRLRFLAPGGARFKLEGTVCHTASGTAELLLSSELVEIRGAPRWVDVEWVAIDARTDSGEIVDVRVSDARISIPAGASSSQASGGRTSARLRSGYDVEYYRSMTGYDQYRERRGIRELVNVHRAYSLLLGSAPARVVDIGSGRGELAEHLIERGTDVTLLDYSPAAMELAQKLIGDSPKAHFVVDEAANLASHVEPGSQDAIFMTDFVEHLSVEELRQVLRACRQVLAPEGALIVHTPERYSGSVITAKAIHGLHVNLFEIDSLEALLRETFGVADVFTWNGFECFRDPGRCIELFALSWPRQPYTARSLPVAGAGVSASERAVRDPVCTIDHPRLSAPFIFDATVEVAPPTAEGALEIAFQLDTGETVARATRKLCELQTLPVHVRLASELLAEGWSPPWERVELITVSTSAPSSELAVIDVCVREHSRAAQLSTSAGEASPHVLL